MNKHKIDLSYIYRMILVFCFSLISLSAVKAEDESHTNDLDMKKIVFGHMGDSYEWHILSWGEGKDLTLYLPVIVYSKEKGLNVFSSAKLKNNESYNGFTIGEKGSPYEGKIVEQQGSNWQRPMLDLSLTKIALSLVLNSILLGGLILGVARWYKKHDYKSQSPGGFVGFMEMFIMMVYDDLIKESIPNNPKRFAPYLLTVFFFIFLNNIISLIPIFPGGVGVTGNIAITFFLAFCTFLAVNVFGTKHYWKEVFWPDVPLMLKFPFPIMPIVEILGVITKPFALMIRLFANMMAGHLAILIFVCLIFIGVKMGPVLQGGLSVLSILFTLFMNLLELLVAFIQAYVFTLLSAVFIGLAQEQKENKTVK